MHVSPPIDSIKDERIATARSLSSRAGRMAQARCVVDGATLIARALAAGAELDYVLQAADADDADLCGRLTAAGIPVHRV